MKQKKIQIPAFTLRLSPPTPAPTTFSPRCMRVSLVSVAAATAHNSHARFTRSPRAERVISGAQRSYQCEPQTKQERQSNTRPSTAPRFRSPQCKSKNPSLVMEPREHTQKQRTATREQYNNTHKTAWSSDVKRRKKSSRHRYRSFTTGGKANNNHAGDTKENKAGSITSKNMNSFRKKKEKLGNVGFGDVQRPHDKGDPARWLSGCCRKGEKRPTPNPP